MACIDYCTYTPEFQCYTHDIQTGVHPPRMTIKCQQGWNRLDVYYYYYYYYFYYYYYYYYYYSYSRLYCYCTLRIQGNCHHHQ